MEDLGRGENRKEHPRGIPGRRAGKDNNQAPKGFEGMNFEQKRRPYNESDRPDKDWNIDTENDIRNGRRRNNS